MDLATLFHDILRIIQAGTTAGASRIEPRSIDVGCLLRCACRPLRLGRTRLRVRAGEEGNITGRLENSGGEEKEGEGRGSY
jgi:hypothetical protein